MALHKWIRQPGQLRDPVVVDNVADSEKPDPAVLPRPPSEASSEPLVNVWFNRVMVLLIRSRFNERSVVFTFSKELFFLPKIKRKRVHQVSDYFSFTHFYVINSANMY